MSSHPDADAFVAAILREPAEVTTRLAFADWLDETGDPPNVAWASFIRLSAEVDQLPTDFERRRELERRLSDLASQVHATLTLDAAHLVGQVEHFWQLLPRPNLTVRLAGYELARELIEFMPESVARESLVLPLALAGQRLFVAAADPDNYDTVQKLEFILVKYVTLVRANADEIRAAILHCYGQRETESVDCILYTYFADVARFDPLPADP